MRNTKKSRARRAIAPGPKVSNTPPSFYDRLKNETELAKGERSTRAGVYKSGIGMDGGYDNADRTAEEAPTAPPPAATRIDTRKRCSRCHEIGHSRPWSKQCRFYKPRGQRTTAGSDQSAQEVLVASSPAQQVNRDADELDNIDAMPLKDTIIKDESDSSDFFDARDYGSSDSAAYFSGESYASDTDEEYRTYLV